jgi:hypothetical protein
MADPLVGKTDVKDAGGKVIFTFDPDASPVKLRAQDATGWGLMELKGNALSLLRGGASPSIMLDAQAASVWIGAPSVTGKLAIRDLQGEPTVVLDGFGGVTAGGNGETGHVALKRPDGKDTVGLSATGSVSAGGNGETGHVVLKRPDGKTTIELKATGDVTVGGLGESGVLEVRDLDNGQGVLLRGSDCAIVAGGAGQAGSVHVRGITDQDVIKLDAAQDGTITLSANGQKVIELKSAGGDVRIGGGGRPGDLFMHDAGGKDTIHLRANDGVLRVGGNGQDGDIVVLRADNTSSLVLSASNGDIVLQNADFAEDFDLGDAADGEPGTVMVLDEHGRLRPSSEPYDRAVAGVVAGAGGFRPAIVLDRQHCVEPRAPLSMVGKAYCKVDATIESVAAGDLLTSSYTSGHAMKASDPARAFGAVLGKAMCPLHGKTGLIPIIVTLQ